MLLVSFSLLPDDSSSVGRGAEQEVGNGMPVEAADDVEMLLEGGDLGPLGDIRGSLCCLEDPDLFISGADRA